MKKRLCIYHKNCVDGFGAALAVWLKYGETDTTYLASDYKDSPPDVTGLDVIIVDFSYKRDVLTKMVPAANSILIIDHHESARNELKNLLGATCIFDIRKSGAVLAWEHFHNKPVPLLFDYIQDRDIWTKKLDDCDAVDAYLDIKDKSFFAWNKLLSTPICDIKLEGRKINKDRLDSINQLIKSSSSTMIIADFEIPCLEAPGEWASDAGQLLSAGEPFAAIYNDEDGVRSFSLRSSLDGENVFRIAELFGGGGHKHSAGFTIPITDLGQLAQATQRLTV